MLFSKNHSAFSDKNDHTSILFNNIPIPIFFKDTKNTYLLVNKAAASLFAKTPEEMRGRSAKEFFPTDHTLFYDEDKEIVRTGQALYKIIKHIKLACAESRWFSIDKVPIRQDDQVIIGVMAVWTDITELKNAHALLEEATYKYHDLTTRIPGGVYVLRLCRDGQARFEYISDSMCQMFDIRQEDALQSADAVHNTIHPEDRPSVDAANDLAARTLKPFHWEGRCLVRGETRWIRVQSNPMLLPDGESLWNGIIIDITDKILLEKELQIRASIDDLTGLHNRRTFIETATRHWETARREKRSFAVAMADIDHFKRVNDTHGHAVGDLVLRQCSQTARSAFRSSDLIGRLGGEEFGVALTGLDADQAHEAMERFRAAVAAMDIRHEGAAINVTISCGVCVAAGGDSCFDQLLIRADKALYQAKNQGRNQVVTAAGEQARVSGTPPTPRPAPDA